MIKLQKYVKYLNDYQKHVMYLKTYVANNLRCFLIIQNVMSENRITAKSHLFTENKKSAFFDSEIIRYFSLLGSLIHEDQNIYQYVSKNKMFS